MGSQNASTRNSEPSAMVKPVALRFSGELPDLGSWTPHGQHTAATPTAIPTANSADHTLTYYRTTPSQETVPMRSVRVWSALFAVGIAVGVAAVCWPWGV